MIMVLWSANKPLWWILALNVYSSIRFYYYIHYNFNNDWPLLTAQSKVRTNAAKYNFTAEKAHFAKSSRQGLENLRSDLPRSRLEFHADHDAVRIINNGQMLYNRRSPKACRRLQITNIHGS